MILNAACGDIPYRKASISEDPGVSPRAPVSAGSLIFKFPAPYSKLFLSLIYSIRS